MKKSSKVGVILALGLTMVSSVVVQDNDSNTGSPFGLQTAQASVSYSGSSLNSFNDRTFVLRASALQLRRRNALVDRIRRKLLEAAPAPVTKIQ